MNKHNGCLFEVCGYDYFIDKMQKYGTTNMISNDISLVKSSLS